MLRGWFIQAAEDSKEQRKSAEQQVYVLDESRLSSMSRFILLMSFSATIATGGILADSAAVVVGAMLIAPLIPPLMGVALALVVLAIAANGASITAGVEGDDIDVVLVGPGKPPQAEPLVRRISSELDREVKFDLQWVPRDWVQLNSE